MHIVVLTGGGDVPGLNVVLQQLVLDAARRGWRVTGVRRGWAGLVELDAGDPASLESHTCALDVARVRKIDRDGGTMLHSSRTQPSRVVTRNVPAHVQVQQSHDGETHDLTPHVLQNLHALRADALVAIGGDDTLSYAGRLHAEGFAVVGIPKTMDNDVAGTEYCMGFGTCVARTVSYLHQLRTCAGSHERIGVIEVMGRNSGASALVPAYLAGADRCVIAEVPCDVPRLAELLRADRARNPSRYAMVVVSEGARLHGGQVLERGEPDAYGHRKLGGIGTVLGEALKAASGVDVLVQSLGYLVRSGAPDPLDCMVGRHFAAGACTLLEDKTYGRMVALRGGAYTHVSLAEAASAKRAVDVERLYDAEQYRTRPFTPFGAPMYMGG